MSGESVKIINAAASRCRCNVITSVDDGSGEAILMDENYEELVQSELTGRPWKFARRVKILPVEAAAPKDTSWDYRLTLPEESIFLRKVFQAGTLGSTNIDYEIMGRSILTDKNEDIYAVYTYRAPEDVWTPKFKMRIIKRLEAIFWRWKRARLEAEEADEKAELILQRAALKDAQEEAPKDPIRDYSLLDIRRIGNAISRS